jgi:polyamine oxidase
MMRTTWRREWTVRPRFEELGGKLSKMMDPSGKDDISILAMQRLFSQYVVLITFFFGPLHHPALENFSCVLIDRALSSTICCVQRAENGPATPLDYFIYDYEFCEPPRVTSLQNTDPTATNDDFVADQRGFESIIHHVP